MEDEFFCVFTERNKVPDLFDCVRTTVYAATLDKPAAERETAASEAAEEANYTKHLAFCAGRRPA